MVPPTNQWLNNYRFDLGIKDFGVLQNAYVNFMYIGTDPNGVQFSNGNTTTTIPWVPVTSPDVSGAFVAGIQVPVGEYTVRHTDPTQTVGVILSATSPYISYAYPAGMELRS